MLGGDGSPSKERGCQVEWFTQQGERVLGVDCSPSKVRGC